jgi:RNA polymerase sigma factor (sigma-70 family)
MVRDGEWRRFPMVNRRDFRISWVRSRGLDGDLSAPALAPVLDPAGRVPDDVDARLAALALRAKSGDIAARNALFLALWPRCAPVLNGVRRNYVWRAVEGRSWTFEDLEQESFLIFCDLVERWSGAEPRFAGYFFSRYRWRVFDALRKWTAAPRRETAIDDAYPVATDETDAIELRLVIAELFAGLSERDRQLLEWRVIDGHTDAEMASALGVSLKTVRRRRQETFARAQACLLAMGMRSDGDEASDRTTN